MTNSEKEYLQDYRQLVHPLPRRTMLRNELPEAASDDSGVGADKVKETEEFWASKQPGTSTITGVTQLSPALSNSGGRKNKRKSSEPKRRGELLLMKRFQWALNDEIEVTTTTSTNSEIEVPLRSAEEGDRPSSGDSGCHSYDGTQITKRRLNPETDVMELDKPIDLISRPTKTESEKHRKSVIKVAQKVKSERLATKDAWHATGASSTKLLYSPNPELIVSRTTNCVNGFQSTPRSVDQHRTVLESNENNHRQKELKVHETAMRSHRETIAVPICADSTEQNSSDSLDNNRSHGGSYVDETSPQKSSQPRSYYKSMSRQRRIEANARERTRVHTISAAFENLRRAVPAYADSQKLSKLAILKIASSYILALACLNKMDYSEEQRKPNLAECVELCTQTIQSEGKARRRGTKGLH